RFVQGFETHAQLVELAGLIMKRMEKIDLLPG
ncbi:MAG: hypothetical protein JWP96_2833, partial [Polaromonas sp.]|nr:hypothetical protein [Polaromonas sp.]